MNQAAAVVSVYRGDEVVGTYQIPECIGTDTQRYTVFTLDGRPGQMKLYPGAYYMPPALRDLGVSDSPSVPGQLYLMDAFAAVAAKMGARCEKSGTRTLSDDWIGADEAKGRTGIITSMHYKTYNSEKHEGISYISHVGVRNPDNMKVGGKSVDNSDDWGYECVTEDCTKDNCMCPAGYFVRSIKRKLKMKNDDQHSSVTIFQSAGADGCQERASSWRKISCCRYKSMPGSAIGWGKCKEVSWFSGKHVKDEDSNQYVERTARCPGEHESNKGVGGKLMGVVGFVRDRSEKSDASLSDAIVKAQCCELAEDGLVTYPTKNFKSLYPSCKDDANGR
jgi:hypothetical protein